LTCFRCGNRVHIVQECRAPASAIVSSSSRGRPQRANVQLQESMRTWRLRRIHQRFMEAGIGHLCRSLANRMRQQRWPMIQGMSCRMSLSRGATSWYGRRTDLDPLSDK
jgi:hypothetical protein